jgi:hypothetical protein
MSVRCETKFQAAITPFGDVAVTLIKMMGHSGTVPSALLAEDVPAALARLKAAVAAHSNEPLASQGSASRSGDEGESVSLAHRALPRIQMLTAAAAARENVMWDR